MGTQIWKLDVRLTKDAICVVSHDDDIPRLTGLDLRINQSSYWPTPIQPASIEPPTPLVPRAWGQLQSPRLRRVVLRS